jgi:2-oxoglutarate dehydrogenase E2 component (dihydrolipoamide succinyltransferase)
MGLAALVAFLPVVITALYGVATADSHAAHAVVMPSPALALAEPARPDVPAPVSPAVVAAVAPAPVAAAPLPSPLTEAIPASPAGTSAKGHPAQAKAPAAKPHAKHGTRVAHATRKADPT